MSTSQIKAIIEGRKVMKGYHQGKFKPKNPEKYMGNPDNIIYRSGWEASFMSRLDNDPGVIHWASEEFSICYYHPIDQKTRRYFPDFYVENNKGEKFVIEIKPAAQTKAPIEKPRKTKRFLEESKTYITNLAKWDAAEKFCSERGWIFQVATEKTLGIKS